MKLLQEFSSRRKIIISINIFRILYMYVCVRLILKKAKIRVLESAIFL